MKLILCFVFIFAGFVVQVSADIVVKEDFGSGNLKEWYCYQQRGGKVELHTLTKSTVKPGTFLLLCRGDIYNKYNSFIALYKKIDVPLDAKINYKLIIRAKAKVNYRPGKQFCAAVRQINSNNKTISYAKVFVKLKNSQMDEYSLEFKPAPGTQKIQLYLISYYLTSRDTVSVDEIVLEKISSK